MFSIIINDRKFAVSAEELKKIRAKGVEFSFAL
jgi:hypothetical protein